MKAKPAFLLYVVTICLLTGCGAAINPGRLVLDDAVRDMIESAEILPDHSYYYTGPQAEPDAIIAIHDKYTLQNNKNLWVRVDISEKILQDWNLIISNDTIVRFPYWGSRILTPEKNQAGIWYSRQTSTVVDFPTAETIVIYTPSPRLKKEFREPLPRLE